MPAGHRVKGVPALLFERLGWPPSSSNESSRPDLEMRRRHIQDAAALKESIEVQLSWLLNTRSPIAYEALEARNRDRVRSTLDYGLPDLSAYPMRDPEAMARLCAHIGQTIAFYEPRLHDPIVDIRRARERGEEFIVEVSGSLRIEEMVTPAIFEIALGASTVRADGG